ncbi:histone-lysine N-methyltransferase SETMAR [Nephila pilipes]|uniref:Histone-lysine N-methyltransferase SETMAR n=1 Tax=Nephila pilipes TaxID=299642 RepID=A0A8X6PQ23_NEPPI|nr:histone-lysine N-methyltransferase SETMAR [Nephila pilipes]
MARRLEKWSCIEVRAVIRFLWAKNVAKWCRSFQAGREHVENRNMEASGRPSSSRTDINTARVEEIIQRDRRVTVPQSWTE